MPQPRQDGASPSTPLLQGSFTAGELAPALYARTDLNKFHSGAKYIRNFCVQATGGLFNRSGTLFVGFVPGGNGVRLISFSFNTEQTYVLVFTNEAIYFASQGGFLLDGYGVQVSVTTPYQAADLFEITYCQSADVLTLCHPNYPPAKLSRTGAASFEYVPIVIGTDLVAPTLTKINGTNEGWPDQDAALAHQQITYTYATTACTLNPPNESPLGNQMQCTNYDLSFNAYGVRNDLWFVPPGNQKSDFFNVYRYLYGVWGFCASTQGVLATGGTGSIGGTLAVVWNDQGVTPDSNTTPPQYVNPFFTGQFGGTISGTTAIISTFTSGTLSVGDALGGAAGLQLSAGTTITACSTGSSFEGSINGTMLSVSALAAGNLSVGDTVLYAGVEFPPTITAVGSSTGGGESNAYTMTANNTGGSGALLALTAGAATYVVSPTQTVAATTIETTNGTFLGSITGTVLSLGNVTSGVALVGDTVTGTGVSSGTTIASNLTGASFIGSFNSNLMYADSVASGTLAVGQRIVGPSASNNTTISSIGTGPVSGGDGNYTLSAPHNAQLQGMMSFTDGSATFEINIAQTASGTLVGNPNYPGACSYFQQRAIYGGGNIQPDGVQTSRTGNYDNFNVSNPLRADDAISVNLVSNKVNAIRHFVSLTDLLAFTNDGCWKISGQTNGADVITPSNIIAVPQAVSGASLVPPIVVAPQIIYVQEKGNSVRELLYDVFRNMYTGTDRSILASHLFFGYTITDWAWAREPWKIVWAVRNDGTLLGFTYLPEQEVYAWHHHDTGQTTGGGCGTSTGQTGFLSVASVTETASTGQGLEDVVYLAAGRELQSGYQICIERMQSRVLGAGNDNITDAWFVDCGLQYNGAPVSSFQAPHLAGQTVAILADGCVKEQQQLDGFGNGTLNQPASVITVGIPIQAQMETLPLDAGEPTIQGKYKRITKMRVYVDLTRGLKAGPMTNDGPVLEEIPSRSVEAWGTPPALFTGQQLVHVAGNWDTYGSLFVQQDYPLPATILGIEPWVQVGE